MKSVKMAELNKIQGVLYSSSGPKTNINHSSLVPDGTKREKVKRVSVTVKGRTSEENLIMASEVADELIYKKFKPPKKIFCKTHPVNPASVPRKLRSAINKRICESASVHLVDPKRKKHSINGVDPLRKDCFKKSKYGCSEPSAKPAVSVPITKEEEDVAETLFALAGMVSLKGETFKAKTIGSKHDEPISSSKDPGILKGQQETAGNRSSSGTENVLAENSPSISTPSKSLTERRPLSRPKLSVRRQLSPNLKVSVPPAHLQTIRQLLRACDERKLGDPASSYQISTAPSWKSGFNDTKPENVMFLSGQAQHCVGLQSVDIFSNLERQHATPSERKDDSLSSRLLLGSGVDRFSIQSSDMVFPSWPQTSAASSRPGSCGDTVSGDKILSSTDVSRKSWKRCIAHVHICRLIQMSEGKDKRPLDASQLRPSQSSSISPEQNEIKGNFTSHMHGSAAYNNCKTGIRVPMNAQHCMDTEVGSKNHSFNFLSLSSGIGPETKAGANKLSNCLDATNQVTLHSVAQAGASLPCSTLDNLFASSAYRDQVAVESMALPSVPHQMHLQMPPYFTNSLRPAHLSHTSNASSTQSAQPKSQQQQQIWAAQLAAQFRSGHLIPSQIANWQNRRQDLQTSSSHMQPCLAPAQSSLEMMGAKYHHISQQQQQFVGQCPMLPLSSSKPPNGPLPSNCEDKGSQFRPDGLMPFQLLCHERL